MDIISNGLGHPGSSRDNMPEPRKRDDWLALAPDLSIGGEASIEELTFSSSMLSDISTSLWEDGYLSLPPLFDPSELASVRDAIFALFEQDIPPVYIYLFDQPWWLFARLGPLLRHFVGENFGVLPNLWAWHLNREGARGWPPHRDCDAMTVFGEGEDAVLMSLSLWLPLTDADESNGCMYIVPQSRYEANSASQKADLMDARSLPAKAGSVLGWPQDVYHWGGSYTSAAKNPRVSLSLEFQNRAFDPLADPLMDMGKLPPFEIRRSLIQDQFAKYRHIDPNLGAGK